MNRIVSLFCCLIVISSCKKQHVPRNLSSITITPFTIDSTSIRAITAVDANTVYFAGSNGKVGHTKNGGKDWGIKTIKFNDTIGPNFRSIAKNGDNIFALSIVSPALLYKMSDDKTELVYQENHKKAFYDSMKFFEDGKHGIAVGDPTEDCASIITTSDGGNSWTKIPCSKLPKFPEGEAFFAASNTNIKVIDNTVWIASGGKKSRILKSEDYGQTWQIYDTPVIQGNGPQGIYSIDFADKNNGIVIGGDYSKAKQNKANKAVTKDGGKTWQLVADGQNPSYKSCVQYVPNTNGKEVFAVGFTGISYSKDGGQTWTQVSEDRYFSIQFVDKNTAWLSGSSKIGKLTL